MDSSPGEPPLKIPIAVGLTGLLLACGQASYPDKVIQICLKADRDLIDLKTMLLRRQKAGRLGFTDGSERAEVELRSMPDAREVAENSSPLISWTIFSPSNEGASVHNLGLPSNQVLLSLSFVSGEPDLNDGLPADARRRFQSLELHPAQSAEPMPDCPRVNLMPSWHYQPGQSH